MGNGNSADPGTAGVSAHVSVPSSDPNSRALVAKFAAYASTMNYDLTQGSGRNATLLEVETWQGFCATNASLCGHGLSLTFTRLWQALVTDFGHGASNAGDELGSLTIIGCGGGTSSSCGGTPALAQSVTIGDLKVLSVAGGGASLIHRANWAQRDYGESFDSRGALKGKTVQGVADALKSGEMTPADVPIDLIVRDGQPLILDTRSAQALQRAGLPRSQWVVVDRTGQAEYEARLTFQLARNGLTSAGFDENPAARPAGQTMP
jgi:hypothetical protein